MNPTIRTSSFLIPGPGLLLLLLVTTPAWTAIDRYAYPTGAPAGLQEVISAEFDILAMDESWERKYSKELSARDLKRIEASATKILREQFGEKLGTGNGYAIVEKPGVDNGARNTGVLLLKPAMLDLHLNAPDLATPGLKDEWVRSAGYATLYLDLYDAATGELLLRVIDRGEARERLQLYEGTRATNNFDLRLLI
jgi:hypothetical protein